MKTKQMVVNLLRRQKWTVNELAEELGMTTEGVAYHLRAIYALKRERVKGSDVLGRGRWTTAYWMDALP